MVQNRGWYKTWHHVSTIVMLLSNESPLTSTVRPPIWLLIGCKVLGTDCKEKWVSVRWKYGVRNYQSIPLSGWRTMRTHSGLTELDFFFLCSTGVWTQGLHLKSLYPSFFCDGFSWARVSWTICPVWLWTENFLISASWLARITGMSHWCLVKLDSLHSSQWNWISTKSLWT
jgi:hypothetical protein